MQLFLARMQRRAFVLLGDGWPCSRHHSSLALYLTWLHVVRGLEPYGAIPLAGRACEEGLRDPCAVTLMQDALSRVQLGTRSQGGGAHVHACRDRWELVPTHRYACPTLSAPGNISREARLLE